MLPTAPVVEQQVSVLRNHFLMRCMHSSRAHELVSQAKPSVGSPRKSPFFARRRRSSSTRDRAIIMHDAR